MYPCISVCIYEHLYRASKNFTKVLECSNLTDLRCNFKRNQTKNQKYRRHALHKPFPFDPGQSFYLNLKFLLPVIIILTMSLVSNSRVT